MMVWPDLWWRGIAAAMILVSLFLFCRALVADRSCGRRRCPKCWYDMSGTPGILTCSECGYVAKLERRLFRTRRRWRWAFVGLLVALCATSVALMPKIRRDGWPSILPISVLVLLTEDVSSQGEIPVWRELERRILRSPNSLWLWQWKDIMTRGDKPGQPPWNLSITLEADVRKSDVIHYRVEGGRTRRVSPNRNGFLNASMFFKIEPNVAGAESMTIASPSFGTRLGDAFQDRPSHRLRKQLGSRKQLPQEVSFVLTVSFVSIQRQPNTVVWRETINVEMPALNLPLPVTPLPTSAPAR